ncbi:MAG: tetratricopeptide repeat protein [Bacteroidales bacterium]|nr:tetratricopeptide repeat protein [Bacteroidales bacterium]MBN2756648.1 tetratricopeptide repeat protein [Bacteroidales bacterium]
MRKISLLFLSIIFFYLFSNAQQSIEILEKKLQTAEEIEKNEILYKLSKEYLPISTEKSLKYGNKAYELAKKMNDKNMQANSLNMIGTAYFKQENYKSAIKYYEKELELRKLLGHNISKLKTYYNIGSAYEANGKTKKALSIYEEILKEARAVKYPSLVCKLYESVVKIYASQNNYKAAFEYLQEFNSYKGSTKITYEKQKINILETKYESAVKESEEKKMQLNIVDSTLTVVKNEKSDLVQDTIKKSEEIGQLYIDKKIKEEKIQKQKEQVKLQRQWLMAFTVFFTVILIFLIIIFSLYRAKRKANKLLALQNAEIIEKSEEISAQSEQLLERNAEIQEQNEEIETQKEEIEIQRDIALKQKEDIVDSINYAKRIQKAIFPSDEYINQILKEYFILLKPRDIVSGDFYWVSEIKNFIIVAVADCTGHGVPGAFMSMLGTSFLNEIVSPRSLDNAGELLNRLRNKVKKSLGQRGREDETKDGMDIALYIINSETLELQFSGAYNPLYILREGAEELIHLKADRQPISVYIVEKDFTNHKFQLQKNDCLYTFSDGYIDQFGGELGQKFKTKKFKELLIENYKKPMKEQREILNQTIIDWMGTDHDQIDDIVVFGLRI